MLRAASDRQLGHYVLGERLGVGGMAEVFSATTPNGDTVAIKRVLPALAEDEEFRAMFWDEAVIMGQLEHPNVVRLLDYGQTSETLFLALEYVNGPSVAKYLRKAARDKLEPNIGASVSIICQLLAGLAYVHSAANELGVALSIVHRDVSPGNVLLSRDGLAKLGDFGIVRSEFLARRTQPGELKGKMGYMSPEQAEGRRIDHRSDLFSAGIILAELLTLRPLFLGKSEFDTLNRTVRADLSTWHRFNQGVPMALRTVTERALSRDPQERFESALAMREALLEAAYSSGLSVEVRDVAEALLACGLVQSEEQASGERARVASLTPTGRETVPPISERDIKWIGIPAFRRGRSIWRAEFSQANLPPQLFAALRRVTSGGVELTSGGRTMYLEIRKGSVVAAHDSGGASPLGRLLVGEAILTPADLTSAIGNSRRGGLRLGEYLLMERKLRDGVLSRLLALQFQRRLADWLTVEKGRISALTHDDAPPSDHDIVPDSIPQTVTALREAYQPEALEKALAPVLDSVVLPAAGHLDPAPLALASGEARVLRSTLEGGALEGRTLRHVLDVVVQERLARKREAEFALLIGLSAGLVQAPGFGRGD